MSCFVLCFFFSFSLLDLVGGQEVELSLCMDGQFSICLATPRCHKDLSEKLILFINRKSCWGGGGLDCEYLFNGLKSN